MNAVSSRITRRAREEQIRVTMPYGIWHCADGREVLFNRRYQPLWSRRPGEAAVEADPTERVRWYRQGWYYTDRRPPWHDRGTLARCEAVLAAWGVA